MANDHQTTFEPRREIDKTVWIAVSLTCLFALGLALTLSGLVR